MMVTRTYPANSHNDSNMGISTDSLLHVVITDSIHLWNQPYYSSMQTQQKIEVIHNLLVYLAPLLCVDELG